MLAAAKRVAFEAVCLIAFSSAFMQHLQTQVASMSIKSSTCPLKHVPLCQEGSWSSCSAATLGSVLVQHLPHTLDRTCSLRLPWWQVLQSKPLKSPQTPPVQCGPVMLSACVPAGAAEQAGQQQQRVLRPLHGRAGLQLLGVVQPGVPLQPACNAGMM